MTITAVGFDLDFTLAVADRDRSDLLADATSAVDAPPVSRAEYLEAHRRYLTGETREPIFADLLADHDTEVTAADLAAAYSDAINRALTPVDGAATLLSTLRERYRVGLLTNGPTTAQRTKLATLGWEDAFDAALVSGDLEAGKPDARAFAALLDALDVAPDETVYVGDNPIDDVAGAADAGLHTVHVCYPGGPSPDPRATAHVDRADLSRTLPDVLARVDADTRSLR